MSDFKAKMHQIPQTPLGELTALPQASSWILGAYFEREGKGRERKGGEERVEKCRKGEREGGRVAPSRAGSPPQAKGWPQNYFPGTRAVESAYWTSY